MKTNNNGIVTCNIPGFSKVIGLWLNPINPAIEMWITSVDIIVSNRNRFDNGSSFSNIFKNSIEAPMTKHAMMNSNTFTKLGMLIIGTMMEMRIRPVINRLFFISRHNVFDVFQRL